MAKTSEVFGISNSILPISYVDRNGLDLEIAKLLGRPTHIALRGESKSGKSWLRQKTIPNAIVIQCRLKQSVIDIYKDALSQLGIRLEIESGKSGGIKGTVEAFSEIGTSIFAKLGFKATTTAEASQTEKSKKVGHDVTDLRFIADLIKASDRKLVIEDFHYLGIKERKDFAHDLKALWDYGVFVVIIGIWVQNNMLLYLNSDLTGRIEEVSINWSADDLIRISRNGAKALGIQFSTDIENRISSICYGNAGILQSILLKTLDHLGVTETVDTPTDVHDLEALDYAAMQYAEQLNPLYQQFAKTVSAGIRARKNSTGIYAHAMAVIIDSSDNDLLKGLKLATLHDRAYAREPRIQKGNLRAVLENFADLQVDENGKGIVIAYNEMTEEITIVDKQLLLYRKYMTITWPWEQLVAESKESAV